MRIKTKEDFQHVVQLIAMHTASGRLEDQAAQVEPFDAHLAPLIRGVAAADQRVVDYCKARLEQ